MKEDETIATLSKQFYELLPHIQSSEIPITTEEILIEKFVLYGVSNANLHNRSYDLLIRFFFFLFKQILLNIYYTFKTVKKMGSVVTLIQLFLTYFQTLTFLNRKASLKPMLKPLQQSDEGR